MYISTNRSLYGTTFPPKRARGIESAKRNRPDPLDERLRAISNRAGRIAWDVLVGLLWSIGMIVVRPGTQHWGLLSLFALPIAISWLVAYIIERREGVSTVEINDYLVALPDKGPFMRKYTRFLIGYSVWFVLVLSIWGLWSGGMTVLGLAVRICILPLAMWGMYVLGKFELRSRFGISREEMRSLLHPQATLKGEKT